MKKGKCTICGCEVGRSLDDGGYGDCPAVLCDYCRMQQIAHIAAGIEPVAQQVPNHQQDEDHRTRGILCGFSFLAIVLLLIDLARC